MSSSAHRLAQRRQLLVATAQLQRAQLRLALQQAPWRPALSGARGALALLPLLAALWRRWRRWRRSP